MRVVGPARRALLAILLLHAGEVLTADRLIDELWGERAAGDRGQEPAGARVAVAQGVGRRGYGAALATTAAAMCCALSLGSSIWRCLSGCWARVARRSPMVGREAQARRSAEALALWHGPALAEFADQPFAREATRETRGAALGGGRGADRRRSAVGATPRVDRGAGEPGFGQPVARAAARAADAGAISQRPPGRCAGGLPRDAQAARSTSSACEPGDELRALERAVLAHDPRLDLGSDEPSGMGLRAERMAAAAGPPARGSSRVAARAGGHGAPWRQRGRAADRRSGEPFCSRRSPRWLSG